MSPLCCRIWPYTLTNVFQEDLFKVEPCLKWGRLLEAKRTSSPWMSLGKNILTQSTWCASQTKPFKPSWWYYFLIFLIFCDKNYLPVWKKQLLCGKHALLGGYRHFSLGLMLVQNYRMAERKAKKTAVQVFSWVTIPPARDKMDKAAITNMKTVQPDCMFWLRV